MAEITRTTSSSQIWITRGHLAALAVATAGIAVLAFLVGLQVGRGDGSEPGTSDAPASAAFLPDASDEEALEILLREVEQAQAQSDGSDGQSAPPQLVSSRALAPPELAGAPQAPRTPAATTQVDPTLSPPPAPPASAPASAPSAASASDWAVQIASYQDAMQADAQVARLVKQDIAAYRVAGLVSGTTWYRVRVGGYRTKDAAAQAMATLESQLGRNDLMVLAAP